MGFSILSFLGRFRLHGHWRRISILVYDVFTWLVIASGFRYTPKNWLFRVFFC